MPISNKPSEGRNWADASYRLKRRRAKPLARNFVGCKGYVQEFFYQKALTAFLVFENMKNMEGRRRSSPHVIDALDWIFAMTNLYKLAIRLLYYINEVHDETPIVKGCSSSQLKHSRPVPQSSKHNAAPRSRQAPFTGGFDVVGIA